MNARTAHITGREALPLHDLTRRRGQRTYPGNAATPVISDRGGETLSDDDLIAVARRVAVLDHIVIDLVKQILTNPSRTSQLSQVSDEQQFLISVERLENELNDVHRGRCGYSASYLHNRSLLELWEVARCIWQGFLQSPPDDPLVELASASIKGFEKQAVPLPPMLRAATASGSLDRRTLNVIGEKYGILQDVVEMLSSVSNHQACLPTWDDLWQELHGASRATSSPNPVPAVNNAQQLPIARISMLLWASVAVTIAAGVPLLTQAWRFSDHEAGARSDDDFWFLIQQTIMQLLGLLVSTIPLRQRKDIPYLAWAAPTGVCAITTILSLALYCVVDKWWSSFCGVLAGAVQAFLVVQLALYGA